MRTLTWQSSACDFAFTEEYDILNRQLTDYVIFDNEDSISIQFDLKLNQDCNNICNIFEIESDQDPLLQFTIEGQMNYFKITTTNNDNFKEYIFIPNANNILPSDSTYHTINITMSSWMKIVSIDNVNQYSSFISNPRFYQPILLSSNDSYSFILNNPSSPTSIGSITNICIFSLLDVQSTPSSPTNITSDVTGADYVFIEGHFSWFTAKLYCQQIFGTHLGTILSDDDLNEALDVIYTMKNDSISDHIDIWIGLNDILNEEDFVWTDGAASDFSLEESDNINHHCGRINVNYFDKDYQNEGRVLVNSVCDPENKYAQFLCNGMHTCFS